MSSITPPSALTAVVLLTLPLLACRVGPTVSNTDQLEDKGHAEVYAIHPNTTGGSSVEVAVENTTDGPIHLSNMAWTILDTEGFAQATIESESNVEIPPRAKEKVTFSVATPAHDIATVRLWGEDLDQRPGARHTPVVTR